MPVQTIVVDDELPVLVLEGETTILGCIATLRAGVAELPPASTRYLTCYVDTPPEVDGPTLAAALAKEETGLAVTRLRVRLNDRPSVGVECSPGVGRDARIASVQRAGMRVATALQGAEDLDLDARMDLAHRLQILVPRIEPVNVVAVVGHFARFAQKYPFEIARTLIRWTEGLEPLGAPDILFDRCADLAAALSSDAQQERRFQEVDRRVAQCTFPDEHYAIPDREWFIHKAFGIAARVVGVLQRLAEGTDVLQEPLWQLVQDNGEGQLEVVFGILGKALRMSLTSSTPRDLREAIERFAMALETQGACLTFSLETPKEHNVALRSLALTRLEAAIVLGAIEHRSDAWLPRELPFWRHEAHIRLSSGEEINAVAGAYNRLLATHQRGDILTPESIDELRRAAYVMLPVSALRDRVHSMQDLLDAQVMLLAVDAGGEHDAWLAASRQYGLTTIASAAVLEGPPRDLPMDVPDPVTTPGIPESELLGHDLATTTNAWLTMVDTILRAYTLNGAKMFKGGEPDVEKSIASRLDWDPPSQPLEHPIQDWRSPMPGHAADRLFGVIHALESIENAWKYDHFDQLAFEDPSRAEWEWENLEQERPLSPLHHLSGALEIAMAHLQGAGHDVGVRNHLRELADLRRVESGPTHT